MMPPDPEMQMSDMDEMDEVELVGLAMESQLNHNNNHRRRRSSRHNNNSNNTRRNGGDYQVVEGDHHGPLFGDDDVDDYISGEDEGLISNLSLDKDEAYSDGESNNLDEYFYYGFQAAAFDSNIDWRCAFWLVVSFLLAAFLAVVLPRFNNFGKPIVESDGTLLFPNGTKKPNLAALANNMNATTSAKSHRVSYDCPVREEIHEAVNYANTTVEESYINRTSQIANNFSGFLQTFHQSEFDGWGKTYDFVKSGMYHWKSTRFPKNLRDGDTIYESACGIGLNLIMTLEILQEVKGVSNLIVYGNEYIPSSANTSNKILDALLPPLNATRGSICAADSTNLRHVPPNVMDLVFTGYISTLLDPLNIDMGVKDNYNYYESICEGDTWQEKKLKEIAQEKQNDWFGQWVSEMIRIAKPGAPVIVEQVSYPFCEAYFDWGGVNQEFWAYAIDKYGWDIDPASIEFEDDRLFRKRYHVFMRKRGGGNSTETSPQPVGSGGGG